MKLFRIVGLLEGLSYLILLFVGVPMKHLYGQPEIVKAVGMPHGLLFIAYLVLAYNMTIEHDWPKKRLAHAFLASILPFGTFLFDKKYL